MSQTRRRAVFIDFDGTYADHGAIPDAHVEAVTAARQAGNLVFLCTGRPRCMVPPEVVDDVFDGIVGAAGGYVDLNGEVLADVRFPPDQAAELVGLLDGADALYMLESPDASYCRPGTLAPMQEILQRALGTVEGPRDILAYAVEVERPEETSFSKVTCFASRVPIPDLLDRLVDRPALLPSSLDLGPGAGEIYLPHIDKAVGLRAVQDHLGLDREQLVGIGDGWNDLEMIRYAGTGVAIQGALEQIVAGADLVVPGPADHGLVQAFRKLGLTGPAAA